MCGIAGIFSYGHRADHVNQRELLEIRDHMVRRGPDGSGLWLSADRRVGLAHRRLAIIDLADRAAQPMCSDDGSLVVTFNGEIYNHRALRAELEHKGYVFRTSSDTEVLLNLYAERGERLVHALRGMYAFAIWDSSKRRLFLARDPYGIKPLYYADDGTTYRFASQVKALAAARISRQQDPAGKVGFLLWGSVPEPFTIYTSIRALPAGCVQWIDELGPKPSRRFASVAEAWADGCPDGLQCMQQDVERIHHALHDSVQHHMVSDVAVGAFLSAGVDSGAIVGLMAEQRAETQAVTLAFAEFQGTGDDEVPLARQVARHYGIGHHVRLVDRVEFQNDLPALFAAMDQPSIDGVNTWFVSKATAELGLKVAVSGLGGDELFGGYGSFRDVPRWVRATRWASHVPCLGQSARKLARPVLAQLPSVHPKAAGLLEFGGSYSGAYFLKRGLFMPWELPNVCTLEVVEEGLSRLGWPHCLSTLLEKEPDQSFAAVAALEATQYMRNQLLRDADWASMAHSLEVRVPFVDYVLLRVVANLRERASMTKAVLAKVSMPPLPIQVVSRRKTGFSTPVATWLQSSALLDGWKRVPALRRESTPWARRFAYALLADGWRG